MATITVQLDEMRPTLSSQQIAEGRYPDEASALQSGVRALQRYEEEQEEKLQLLRREIQKGFDSGIGEEASVVFNRLRAKHGLPPRVR